MGSTIQSTHFPWLAQASCANQVLLRMCHKEPALLTPSAPLVFSWCRDGSGKARGRVEQGGGWAFWEVGQPGGGCSVLKPAPAI